MDKFLDCRRSIGVLVDEIPEGADPEDFASVWIDDSVINPCEEQIVVAEDGSTWSCTHCGSTGDM